MTVDKPDIGALARKAKELAEKATPGPWRVEEDWTAELYGADGSLIGKIVYPQKLTDAHLAAFARTALPALADEVMRLTRELADVDSMIIQADFPPLNERECRIVDRAEDRHAERHRSRQEKTTTKETGK